MPSELEFVKRLRRDDRGTWPRMTRDSVIVPVEKYVEPEWPMTRVRILKPFHLEGGRLAEPGMVVSLAEPEARGAVALGRAALV